ncbi:MAG: DUF1566 domain-containing protein, partial [Legionellaceae bacterium]|nr:DUF1566 domain-containing protein [Legionellaceae bacterium]
QGSNTPEVLVSVGVEAALNIGDNYLGGIVFEVDACNTGKVVTGPLDAPDELSSQWSSQHNNITTDLDDGAQNTTNIIDSDAGCTNANNCAAFRCRNLDGPTPDWYLPARNELSAVRGALCSNLSIPCNFGGFSSTFYWSSSQFDIGVAWGESFPLDVSGLANKFDGLRVRCVRAFIP